MLLIYQKACRIGKLTSELIAAIPSLAPIPVTDPAAPPGSFTAVFTVAGDLTTTSIDCPDTTSKPAVDAVVAAHDASTPSAWEVTIATLTANKATLTQKSQAALDDNDKFLAIASPTTAQTLAQVKMLTRECNALIRLAINAFDTTTGT